MKITSTKPQIRNKSKITNHKRFGILNFGHWNLFGNCLPVGDPPKGEKLPARRSLGVGWEIGNSESGITLVVSILLLASTTFISFALSSIIIREIRNAQTILEAEPAISGASSGGEIGIFRLFREAGGTNTSGSTPQSGASYNVVSDLYDLPYLFSTTNGNELQIGLYDAEQPENKSADYGTVTVINDGSSDTVTVEVFSWADLETTVWSTSISAGSQGTSPNLSSVDDRYLVKIDPVNPSGSASGQIRATNNAGASKGVPSPTPGIDVTGTRGSVQRKIEIDFQ